MSPAAARRCFYGYCAILLGAWEALAFAGRAPTITATVRAHRHPLARMIVVAWSLGLLRHLTRQA